MTATTIGRTLRICLPDAQDVCVLGAFNHWSTTATPLVHVGGWVWQVTLPLEVEVRELAFFVWGQGQRFGRIVRQAAGCSSGGPHWFTTVGRVQSGRPVAEAGTMDADRQPDPRLAPTSGI